MIRTFQLETITYQYEGFFVRMKNENIGGGISEVLISFVLISINKFFF